MNSMLAARATNLGREGRERWAIGPQERSNPMLNLLWLIAVFFVVLWVLGFALHFTLGGLIHVLLVLAIVSVLVRIIMGHRIV
jgi:hypothetical protein